MYEIKYKKALIQAVKIAIGSSLTIFLAEEFRLQFATSAGTITLLTIVTTKWETVRLSLYRILSFGISVVLAGILFQAIHLEWVAFGAYIFLVVIICNVMDWKAAISVNAVIGTHFLTEKNFTYEFIGNEFFLVVIGITVAVVLNLFHGNRSQENKIIQNIRAVEGNLQMILGELASYLDNRSIQRDVWQDIRSLKENLHQYTAMAYEYQENTFYSHPGYYISYFEMRLSQCNVLHNLHSEMRKIRKMPKQAKVISQYILYLADYVTESNVPMEQLEKLNFIFQRMEHEPLPKSREEFISRAMLYHILMDLEDFLILKKRFTDSLDEKKKKIYWKQED